MRTSDNDIKNKEVEELKKKSDLLRREIDLLSTSKNQHQLEFETINKKIVDRELALEAKELLVLGKQKEVDTQSALLKELSVSITEKREENSKLEKQAELLQKDIGISADKLEKLEQKIHDNFAIYKKNEEEAKLSLERIENNAVALSQDIDKKLYAIKKACQALIDLM